MTTVHHLPDLDGAPHANAFPESEPKTIRLTLAAGDGVDPHRHPGREIVFYLVEGAIELQVGSETYDLEAGDIARFDGDQDIAPTATEDSTAVIVLAEEAD
jgi:quercetin dioxygenase-like cupin family protein